MKLISLFSDNWIYLTISVTESGLAAIINVQCNATIEMSTNVPMAIYGENYIYNYCPKDAYRNILGGMTVFLTSEV